MWLTYMYEGEERENDRSERMCSLWIRHYNPRQVVVRPVSPSDCEVGGLDVEFWAFVP